LRVAYEPSVTPFGVTLDADSVNAPALNWDESMRVILAAIALSALSFVAGVAGDLSSKPANSGVTVTLRIPPPIPADAPRARPILSTTTAAAETPRRAAAPVDNTAAAPNREPNAAAAKQRYERVLRMTEWKPDARLAAKTSPIKAA